MGHPEAAPAARRRFRRRWRRHQAQGRQDGPDGVGRRQKVRRGGQSRGGHGDRRRRHANSGSAARQRQERLREELGGGGRVQSERRSGRRARQGRGRFPEQEALRLRFQRSEQGGSQGRQLLQAGRQVEVRDEDHGQLQRANPDRQAARLGGHQVRRKGRRRPGFRGHGDLQQRQTGGESRNFQAGKPIFRATRRRAQHL